VDLAPIILVAFFLLVTSAYVIGLWFIHPALSLLMIVGVSYFIFKDEIRWKRN
jgi:hypothetical protein